MDATAQKRILIVEDEEKIAKLLAAELARAGYAVHTEWYGQAALDYAAEHELDLVLLDLRLPDMSGYTVCKELRKRFHAWALPILMVTAMGQPIDQLRGFAHGATSYLTKPFELTDIMETVTELLGESAHA